MFVREKDFLKIHQDFKKKIANSYSLIPKNHKNL